MYTYIYIYIYIPLSAIAPYFTSSFHAFGAHVYIHFLLTYIHGAIFTFPFYIHGAIYTFPFYIHLHAFGAQTECSHPSSPRPSLLC